MFLRQDIKSWFIKKIGKTRPHESSTLFAWSTLRSLNRQMTDWKNAFANHIWEKELNTKSQYAFFLKNTKPSKLSSKKINWLKTEQNTSRSISPKMCGKQLRHEQQLLNTNSHQEHATWSMRCDDPPVQIAKKKYRQYQVLTGTGSNWNSHALPCIAIGIRN